MKIINFRGDLTDNSAKKEALNSMDSMYLLLRIACPPSSKLGTLRQEIKNSKLWIKQLLDALIKQAVVRTINMNDFWGKLT